MGFVLLIIMHGKDSCIRYDTIPHVDMFILKILRYGIWILKNIQ